MTYITEGKDILTLILINILVYLTLFIGGIC